MITMQTIAAIGLIYLVGINLAGFIIMGVVIIHLSLNS